MQEGPAPLLRGHPAVDDVLIFPRRRGPRAWLRFVRRLRARRFDATVDAQGNAKSGAVALLSGARLRAGLHPSHCREPLNLLATNRRGPRGRGPHGVDRAWTAAQPLGVEPGPDVWGLQATAEELHAWEARCRRAGADPQGPLLAVNLTAPGDPRSWFTEPLAHTLRRAVAEGYQALLNGPAARRPLAEELRRGGPGIHDLCGHDDLRGLRAQFESMGRRPDNVLLSPDSGPVHVAVAVGLRVVCLSGPQDPRRTGPRSGGVALTAWEGLACAPCLERVCVRRPADRACMARLTPERVVTAIRAVGGVSIPRSRGPAERSGRAPPRTP